LLYLLQDFKLISGDDGKSTSWRHPRASDKYNPTTRLKDIAFRKIRRERTISKESTKKKKISSATAPSRYEADRAVFEDYVAALPSKFFLPPSQNRLLASFYATVSAAVANASRLPGDEAIISDLESSNSSETESS
jgi:hypothetical protein